MGRPAKGVLRLSEDHQAANTRRERQQRRDHAHGELFHHAAELAVCAADRLPRLQSRRAPHVPRAVCAARHAVPERLTWLRADDLTASAFLSAPVSVTVLSAI